MKKIWCMILSVVLVLTLTPAALVAEGIGTDPALAVGVSGETENSAELSFTGSADGTVYYAVQPSDEGTAPGAPELLAGDSVAVTTAAAVTVEVTGLQARTGYTAYALLQDGAGSRSAVVSQRFSTNAGAAPLLGILSLFIAGLPVNYIDETGAVQTTAGDVTEVTAATTVLNDTGTNGGWYVANGNITTGQLTVTGDIHLILADGCTLNADGVTNNQAGIKLMEGNSLTIYAQTTDASTAGSLTATGGESAGGYAGKFQGGAGIGTNGFSTQQSAQHGGTLTVNGGNITARAAGGGSAGIGSGVNGTSSVEVIINDGTVVAYGGIGSSGSTGGAAIGIGEGHGIAKDITINGGTVEAHGGDGGAGIGGGRRTANGRITITNGTVMAYGNGAAGIGSGAFVYDVAGQLPAGTIAISGGTVTAVGDGHAAGIGHGTIYKYADGGRIEISGGTVNATGSPEAAGIGGGGGENDRPADPCSGEDDGGTIIISGGIVTATAGKRGAGIGGGERGAGGMIEISGGEITATGGAGGAGIGGGYAMDIHANNDDLVFSTDYLGGGSGTITISGGTIVAIGGDGAPAVGSGGEYQGTDGQITITDGTLEARGGNDGAGLGGGRHSANGQITITNGTVEAYGGMNAAGIGSGASVAAASRPADTIAISGGNVTATGGQSAAGIGHGSIYQCADGGRVEISDGIVNATGGDEGAGIGGGGDPSGEDDGGTIVISGGTVAAAGGKRAAGIGGGERGAGGTITISGCEITATGGAGGAGIGGGYARDIQISDGRVLSADYLGGAPGNITISSGTIVAAGGDGAPAVGSGAEYQGTDGAVTVTGGSIQADFIRAANVFYLGGLSNTTAAYPTVVTLERLRAKSLIASLTVMLRGNPYPYQIDDMYTNTSGELYLYLPPAAVVQAAQTAQTGSVRYSGSITAKRSGRAQGMLYLPGSGDSGGSGGGGGNHTTILTPGSTNQTPTTPGTGVTVSGTLPPGTTVSTGDISLGDDEGSSIIRRWMDDENQSYLFGTDLSLSTDSPEQLTVTLPVGTQYNGQTVSVLHNRNGNLQILNTDIQDGAATVMVTLQGHSSFAVFAAARAGAAPDAGSPTNTAAASPVPTAIATSAEQEAVQAPKTGDTSNLHWWLLLLVSGAGLAAVTIGNPIGKRRKKV